MKNKTLLHVAVTVFAAVAVVTAFWIGLGVGSRPVEVQPRSRRQEAERSII